MKPDWKTKHCLCSTLYVLEVPVNGAFFHGSLTEEMVTAMGKNFELLSRGIHMGKLGIMMMPVCVSNR